MIGIASWDRYSVLYLNGIFAHGPVVAYAVEIIANNNLARGLPVFFSILWLWFRNDDFVDRAKIAAGVLAACVATVCSVLLQRFLPPFHLRPFLELAPNLFLPDPAIASALSVHPNSWPSDTATLFGALSLIVINCRPRLGIAVFLWTVIVIDLPRVVFGYHYPSDIISGIVLGFVAVWLGTTFAANTVFARVRLLLRTHEAMTSSILAIVLAEMEYRFAATRQLVSLALRLIGFR